MHAIQASALLSFLFLPFLLLSSTVHAHATLKTPTPYTFNLPVDTTAPIFANGSDYPCKIPPGGKLVANGDGPTVMAIGVNQNLTFNGTAVHGGGSCQLSLTTDFPPTRDTVWKVIHSIEGGCPARNQSGNLKGPNEDVYQFQIPKGIEPGEYVFAWTWVARIGGLPEFYMNCAPIKVVQGKVTHNGLSVATAMGRKHPGTATRPRNLNGDDDITFPDIYMANMGPLTNNCTTDHARLAERPIKYPNPGESVAYEEGTENLLAATCDGNPRLGLAASSTSSAPTSTPTATDSPANGDEESASIRMYAPTWLGLELAHVATIGTLLWSLSLVL